VAIVVAVLLEDSPVEEEALEAAAAVASVASVEECLVAAVLAEVGRNKFQVSKFQVPSFKFQVKP
jgi:hypothetical protein